MHVFRSAVYVQASLRHMPLYLVTPALLAGSQCAGHANVLRVRRLATGGVFESSMGAVISGTQGPNGPLGVQVVFSLASLGLKRGQ